jgi:hypothetical protein
VLRFLQSVGYPRDVYIHASQDHGTHWLLTFAVPSIEDPGRIFMYASIVVEKGTGYVYSFPPRARHSIDGTDIASVRQGCTRITPGDLAQRASAARSQKVR